MTDWKKRQWKVAFSALAMVFLFIAGGFLAGAAGTNLQLYWLKQVWKEEAVFVIPASRAIWMLWYFSLSIPFVFWLMRLSGKNRSEGKWIRKHSKVLWISTSIPMFAALFIFFRVHLITTNEGILVNGTILKYEDIGKIELATRWTGGNTRTSHIPRQFTEYEVYDKKGKEVFTTNSYKKDWGSGAADDAQAMMENTAKRISRKIEVIKYPRASFLRRFFAATVVASIGVLALAVIVYKGNKANELRRKQLQEKRLKEKKNYGKK